MIVPYGVFAVPNQVSLAIGHLSWDADLVEVEVVGLLVDFSVFVGPVVYLCQGFVTVGSGIDISIPAVPNDLKESIEVVLTQFRF